MASFDKLETMRGRLYYRAIAMIERGFKTEACILILATWNIARFRRVIRSFDLVEFENAVEKVSKLLQPLNGKSLMSTNLSDHRKIIVESFNKLAGFGGVEMTGTSKVLHLLNPKVFVMWDRFIRDRRAQNGDGYFEFLLGCQQKFQGLKSPGDKKTLAKCIDEFNYVTITAPAMEAERTKRETARQEEK